MPTRYITFVLRLRLNDQKSEDIPGNQIYGSLHQIGLEKIRYFDSFTKLEQALNQLTLQEKEEEQIF